MRQSVTIQIVRGVLLVAALLSVASSFLFIWIWIMSRGCFSNSGFAEDCGDLVPQKLYIALIVSIAVLAFSLLFYFKLYPKNK